MVVAITNFCKKFEIAGILGASHILSISIFENTEKTIESNRSADRVRKKRPLCTLLLPTRLQTNFLKAQDVSSPKMESIW